MVRKLRAVRGLALTTPAWRRALVAMCDRLGVDPDFVASAISFETGGTFDPKIQNPKSRATGLIQFAKVTADGWGMTLDQIRAMSAEAQLALVERYLRPFGKLRTVGDVYLAIFAPGGIGKNSDATLYATPSQEYQQNATLDTAHKGRITVADAIAPVVGIYTRAASGEPIIVDDGVLADPFSGSGPAPCLPASISSDGPDPMGARFDEAAASPPDLPLAAPVPAVAVAPPPTVKAWPGAAVDLVALGALALGVWRGLVPLDVAIAAAVAICAGRTVASSSGVYGALLAPIRAMLQAVKVIR